MCQITLIFSWETSHFMVEEGIVLGHVVSPRWLEVDWSEVKIIKNLPPRYESSKIDHSLAIHVFTNDSLLFKGCQTINSPYNEE